ncbi:MAG: hypothetical protein JWN78_795 [Bacteroidota bacterium]|nr:hypothetical protein [Bacteroidota bacterium]
MKRTGFGFFVCCLIILAAGCKKNNRNAPPTGSSNSSNPAAIITYISNSGRIDSLEYLLNYDPARNKLQRMFANPFGSYPPFTMNYITLPGHVFQLKNHYSYGLDYIVSYYTDANNRVTRLVDSLFGAVYQFNYNNNGYLYNIVKSRVQNSSDTTLYAYFFYDGSDNINKIVEHTYSVYDSVWVISADISIEQTALTFPGKAHSTFSIGRPFIYSNKIVPYQTLLFIFQTGDIPFNFGKQQRFLPSKFTNTSIPYSRTIVDDFSYTADSLNRISGCTDHSYTSSSGSNFLTILKDTIIY